MHFSFPLPVIFILPSLFLIAAAAEVCIHSRNFKPEAAPKSLLAIAMFAISDASSREEIRRVSKEALCLAEHIMLLQFLGVLHALLVLYCHCLGLPANPNLQSTCWLAQYTHCFFSSSTRSLRQPLNLSKTAERARARSPRTHTSVSIFQSSCKTRKPMPARWLQLTLICQVLLAGIHDIGMVMVHRRHRPGSRSAVAKHRRQRGGGGRRAVSMAIQPLPALRGYGGGRCAARCRGGAGGRCGEHARRAGAAGEEPRRDALSVRSPKPAHGFDSLPLSLFLSLSLSSLGAAGQRGALRAPEAARECAAGRVTWWHVSESVCRLTGGRAIRECLGQSRGRCGREDMGERRGIWALIGEGRREIRARRVSGR